MGRRAIFNDAVRSTPVELERPQYYAAHVHIIDFYDLLEKAENAYTYLPDKTALPAMQVFFKKIIAASVSATRDYGAVSRQTGEFLGNDEKAAFKALDEERKYQETKVRETFNSAGKNFTLTQELVMMRSYLRREIGEFPARADTKTVMTAIRKVAAMALRGCETPSL